MRLLFVCVRYYPFPTANDVCVMRLQETLYQNGIESDVVCESDKDEVVIGKYGYVYCFSHPHKSNYVARKIRRFMVWPIRTPQLIDKYYNGIMHAKYEHEYSGVIAVMRPIEGALACSKSGKYILYELDSITNNGDNLYGLKRILSHRAAIIERYLYNKAEHIMHMECHSQYYSAKATYSKYERKVTYTDIPHLVADNGDGCSVQNSKDRISVLYCGLLDENRNPLYAIELFSEISKHTPIECLFFSKGCENMLKKASNDHPTVIFSKGYVSQEALHVEKRKADLFLSIGNPYSGTVTSVPSKIFEYMATGKPIIHIVGGVNDSAIPYLEKYQNAVLVDTKHDLRENVQLVSSFICANRNTRIDLATLRSMFPENTPEFTVNRILEIIDNTK